MVEIGQNISGVKCMENSGGTQDVNELSIHTNKLLRYISLCILSFLLSLILTFIFYYTFYIA